MRVALLSYRSKPYCGGQGVYVRHLSRALTDIGHTVEVLSGPPYPILDDDITLTAAAEPRPVPRARSLSAAAPARVPFDGRCAGVRCHVYGGVPRAADVFASRLATPPRSHRTTSTSCTTTSRSVTDCSASSGSVCRSSRRCTIRSPSTDASSSRPRRGAARSRCVAGTRSLACRVVLLVDCRRSRRCRRRRTTTSSPTSV